LKTQNADWRRLETKIYYTFYTFYTFYTTRRSLIIISSLGGKVEWIAEDFGAQEFP
jgi:hypothetical protein